MNIVQFQNKIIKTKSCWIFPNKAKSGYGCLSTYINARKKYCKNGHKYTLKNTYHRKRKNRLPERDCITCRNKRNALRYTD